MTGINLNYLDIFILVVIGLMALKGGLRGFIAEVSGLIGLVGGIVLAGRCFKDLSAELQTALSSHAFWVDILAYGIILVGFMLLTSVAALLLAKVTKFSVANVLNRTLGGIVGAAKGFIGAAIICVIICCLSPHSNLVRQSTLLPYVNNTMEVIGSELPSVGKWSNLLIGKKG